VGRKGVWGEMEYGAKGGWGGSDHRAEASLGRKGGRGDSQREYGENFRWAASGAEASLGWKGAWGRKEHGALGTPRVLTYCNCTVTPRRTILSCTLKLLFGCHVSEQSDHAIALEHLLCCTTSCFF
jgi:hypothetical protein